MVAAGNMFLFRVNIGALNHLGGGYLAKAAGAKSMEPIARTLAAKKQAAGMPGSQVRAEAVLAWLALALCVSFLVEGAKLKSGVIEPIGPGVVPIGVAIILRPLLFERHACLDPRVGTQQAAQHHTVCGLVRKILTMGVKKINKC